MADEAREAGRILLALVDTRTTPNGIHAMVERVDVTALVDVATSHRVIGLVHRRLVDAGVDLPQRLAARLERERALAAALQLKSYRTIAAINSAMKCPFLVVKGAALGAVWYRDPSLRWFTDVDVLVRRRDFGYVIDSLVGAGFDELSANWGGFLDHEVSEIPLAGADSTVDLHWDLVGVGAARRELDWDMAPLFERAEQVSLGSEVVATLDPPDTLLHLCINGGLDGARTLLRLVDIDVVARSGRVDWTDFAKRAQAARACALSAAVLQRCASIVGTPLPHGLLADLEPYRGWLRLNALVDRQRSSGRRLTSGVASGALLASGRATRIATLGRLARTIALHSLTKLGRSGLTDSGGELDWHRVSEHADPASDRQRYLRWVAAG
jgi:hypothetical protein